MGRQETNVEEMNIPSPSSTEGQQEGMAIATGEGLGDIQCDKSVFREIAASAAAKVEGIATVGGRSTIGDVLLFRGKESGVEVRARPDDNFGITVNVEVAVIFGHNIYEVCTELQRRIKDDIESITNYSVRAVNVWVQGLEAPRPQEPSAAQPPGNAEAN